MKIFQNNVETCRIFFFFGNMMVNNPHSSPEIAYEAQTAQNIFFLRPGSVSFGGTAVKSVTYFTQAT